MAPPDAARLWRGAIVFLTTSVCFFILARGATDPDLLGHIRFGQEILESGIPEFDRYAFTTGDQPWINHELMSEVTFAAVYGAAGNFGLHMLRLGIALVIIGLLYRHAIRSGLDPLRGGILMVLISFLLVNGTITVRPQLFTYLFLLALLLLFDAAARGRSRIVWLVPLLMIVWVNFHGGALAGLALVAVWCGGHWLGWLLPDAQVRGDRLGDPVRATGILLASSAGMLVNPYGWDLFHFLLTTATVPRPDITEWQPTPLGTRRGLIYLLLTAGTLLALHWTEVRKDLPRMCVLAAIIVLPLVAVRHIPIFAIGIGVLLPAHLVSALSRLPADSGARASPAGVLRPAMIALSIFTGFVMIAGALPDLRCVKIDAHRSITFPVRAVEWIRRSQVEGRLATFFDWGEYAIWHLEPAIEVSMDGRRETVFPDSIREEYLRFQDGLPGWEDHIDRRGADMALVTIHRPMFSLMKLKPGWELMYEDSLAAVFAPAGSPQAEALRSTPVPAGWPQHGIGYCMP